MTDEFEDLVRSAGRGLATSDELPTYHDAWHRGRRRRNLKRGALAMAGVLALVVAMSGVATRWQGGTTIETDDVAADAVGVPPAPTPSPTAAAVATTAPVVGPTVSSAPDLDIETPAPTPGTRSGTTDEPGDQADAARPDEPPSQVVPPESTSPSVAPSPGVEPSPAQEPTATPTATPPPTATATPTPEPTVGSIFLGGEDDPTETTETTPEPDATPSLEDSTVPDPQPLETRPPAAARVIGKTENGPTSAPSRITDVPAVACDTSGDGEADAECRLYQPYPCESEALARDDYVAVDTTGDGLVDTCTSLLTIFCDTSGDGFGDTPCRVEALRPDAGKAGPEGP